MLLGHLRQLVTELGPGWHYTLLTHGGNSDLGKELPEGSQHICAPTDASWVIRTLWLWRHGAGICERHAVDLVFSPAGMLSWGVSRPQIVLAQNPWPLIPAIARRGGRIKAWLQRRAFARAQKTAVLMVFNSQCMLNLYRDRFGPAQRSIVAYQGIDECLFTDAATVTNKAPRSPVVLSVSVMARHKAIEVLVAAFALVAAKLPQARLVLAGSWPEARYRAEIEARLANLGLASRVKLLGYVARAELVDLYREARVFCLLSRCESFGIPAIEAQAFGTPSVVAGGTAAPEVAGAGCLVVAQDDVEATAGALHRLLTDDGFWAEMSARARRNAGRFHWRECSAPLLAAMRELATVR